MPWERCWNPGNWGQIWFLPLKERKDSKAEYGLVCELETQILLAGDLDLIEKGELNTLKKR